MSMDIDAFDMGRQAAEMVKAIQEGKGMQQIPPAYARKAIVSTNLMIARKMGIAPVFVMRPKDSTNQKVFRKTLSIN